MFFQFAKYDENRWLNTKLFKNERRNSPKKTIRLSCTNVTYCVYCCVIQQLVTSDGTQNDPGHPDNEWG